MAMTSVEVVASKQCESRINYRNATRMRLNMQTKPVHNHSEHQNFLLFFFLQIAHVFHLFL